MRSAIVLSNVSSDPPAMRPVGALIQGPAILEQPDATTVIDPDLSARVDGFGNVIVERSAR